MLARTLRPLAFVVAVASTTVAYGHGTQGVRIADVAPPASFSGYVEEVVVQDLAKAQTRRFPVLVADDGTRYLLRGAAAAAAVPGSSVNVRGTAGPGTLDADRLDVTARADLRAAMTTSQPAQSYRGVLRLGHADNFDGNPSRFFFSLFDAAGHVDVKLAYELGVLENGTTATVTGRIAADGELAAEAIVIESSASPTTLATPTTMQSMGGMLAAPITNQVLVIPIKFKDASGIFPADPYTISAINSAVFGVAPTASVAEYYKEVSYGQQLVAGTVASSGGGWLQAAVAAPSPAACDTSIIQSQAEAAATAAGYNLSNYQNIVYLFARTGFSCGWSGLAYVGWGRAWINQSTNLLVIGHELGHNFGLLHAGSLDCGAVVIGGSCSASEYGEPFGIMGNQSAMHINAVQKRILNWIPLSSTPTHGGGSQTYTLTPIESPGGSTYAVQIPAAANRTYWVEYRQPIGFDSGLSSYPNNGAQLRVASPFEASSGSDDTEFLDLTPATSAFTDGALLAGQSFNDSVYGITINVLSASASALSVQVIKSGVTGTTTTLASTPNPSTSGQSVTFTASVTGTAPTGTVGFVDGGSAIPGCSGVALSGTANTRSATCTTSVLAAGSHSIVANYSGDAGNGASSSAALAQTVNGSSPAPTTTTVAGSPNPSTSGQTVTFTASVTGSAPTGTVAFKDGGNTISGCTAVALGGSGNTRTAACATAALSTGTHSIVASYSGNTANAASNSAASTQTVNGTGPSPSTTTVASSPNPSIAGQTVTLTASVTGSSPTGAVAFRDGTAAIPGCATASVSGTGSTRTASCSVGALSAGTHAITAAYTGDAANSPSTSGALSQAVNLALSTTTIASSANPITVGLGVAFTASVSGYAPSGTVAFRSGGSAIAGCSAVPLAGASASCTTSGLPAGTQSITAAYSGDANNAASTSAAFAETVRAATARKRRDMDGDGRSDIVWRNGATGQTMLWLMNGSAIKSSAVILSDPNYQVAFTGDFNGDGRTDLVWRHVVTGETVIWLMNGTTFIGGASISTDPNWRVVLVGDFNGDGIDDLVWRNSATGATRLTIMSGGAIASTSVLMPDPNWTATAIGDFNGDGKSDLVWRNANTGETVVWLMNGGSIIGAGTLLVDPNWTVTHVADFNGDGKSDVVWRNTATGNTAMWLMNGVALAAGGGLLADPNWRITHVDDLDGDGRSDLVWRNAATGDTAVWLMNGLSIVAGAGLPVGGAWSIVATEDFDGSAKADLVWRNSSTGETAAWLMNGLSLSLGYQLSSDPNWSVVP
jgi:hypothetical protein